MDTSGRSSRIQSEFGTLQLIAAARASCRASSSNSVRNAFSVAATTPSTSVASIVSGAFVT